MVWMVGPMIRAAGVLLTYGRAELSELFAQLACQLTPPLALAQ